MPHYFLDKGPEIAKLLNKKTYYYFFYILSNSTSVCYDCKHTWASNYLAELANY